ncbi:MAG: lipopolysaccharide heptosyltransferase I [Lautropia sp.]
MHVLIVKMSSMGDVVHAQALASDVLAAFPGARIDWVVERAFAPICALNPAIARVVPIAWRRWRSRLRDPGVRAELADFLRSLRGERYDHILDCQGLIKSAAIVRLARGANRIGPDRRSARESIASLCYDTRVSVPRDWHVIRRNRAIGALGLGYPLDASPAPALHAAPPDPLAMPWWPAQAPVVLVTGASRDAKLWPEAHWLALVDRLAAAGLPVVWFWGSDAEKARAERLQAAATAAASASGTRLRSVVPPFLTVGEAASVLGAAGAVVGLDTGFTHLAAALGVPTVGIFCDFDAVQCAVSGPARCESFGGVGLIPPASQVIAAAERCLRL